MVDGCDPVVIGAHNKPGAVDSNHDLDVQRDRAVDLNHRLHHGLMVFKVFPMPYLDHVHSPLLFGTSIFRRFQSCLRFD